MFSYFSSYIFGTESNKLEQKESKEIVQIIDKQPKKINKSLTPKLPLIKNPKCFYYLSLILEEDNSWSIHGLWPQYSINRYPKFCRDIDFNVKKIEPIKADLEKYWYSNKGTDDNFWKHEYLKHGTCNFNDLNELEYFKTTLDLYLNVIDLNYPERFYNENTKKCLIPINRSLKVFEIDFD